MHVKIGKNKFNVKTLIDPQEQQEGMMFKKFKSDNEGMLFLMGGDEQSFWMKNCICELDIIMIKNNVIVNIHKNCPPCNEEPCPSYGGKGNIVLELKGGTCEKLGIEPGDSVHYIFD